jgi:hypothetical protein
VEAPGKKEMHQLDRVKAQDKGKDKDKDRDPDGNQGRSFS